MPGFIRTATHQDRLLWTSWRYGPTDEDSAWDWWAILDPTMAEHLLEEIKGGGIVVRR